MKNSNLITIIIIIAVIIIAIFVLRREADAPTKKTLIVQDSQTEKSSYIWLTLEDARQLAQSNWEVFRVIETDGEPQPVTMDYRPWRINASVVNGVVTEFSIEGE